MENTFRRNTEDLLKVPLAVAGSFQLGRKAQEHHENFPNRVEPTADHWGLETRVQASFGKMAALRETRWRIAHTTSTQSLLVVSSCEQQVKDEENWLVELNIGRRMDTEPIPLAE